MLVGLPLPIRDDIIYDLFIAAVHAHTFCNRGDRLSSYFQSSTYLEELSDVEMFWLPPQAVLSAGLAWRRNEKGQRDLGQEEAEDFVNPPLRSWHFESWQEA